LFLIHQKEKKNVSPARKNESSMVNTIDRILLIDDDIQVRESVSLSLETAGYTVMVAGTPEEGLQDHKTFQASLVIMDVVALEDGDDEPLRRVSQQPVGIPMITLTGNIPSSVRSTRFLHNYFQPICTLQKPFTMDELLQIVQRVLAR
jgi:DNA-binding response OmpR family regulator